MTMIKSKAIRLMFLICSVCLLFSCKDDDGVKVDFAANIEGSYKGELRISVDGADLSTSTKRISIIKETDNSIKLELKNFVFGTTNIGDIIVPGVKVESSGEQCFLKETHATLTLEGLGELNITVSGSVSDNTAVINIKVKAGAESINVDFTGEKQVDADLAALVSGVYVGEFTYEKINSTADIRSYTQSFTITKIEEDLVKIDMSNIHGFNPTFDAIEVNRVGDAITFTATKELNVNGTKMIIDKMELSGANTARMNVTQKKLTMIVRTNTVTDNKDQQRVSTVATVVEKANQPFLSGITWTKDPEGAIIGDPKIVNTREGFVSEKDDPNYGKIKYTGEFTYYVLPGTTPEQKKQLVGDFLTTDEASYIVESYTSSGMVPGADFSNPLILCTVVAKDQLSYTVYQISAAETTSISKTKTYKFDAFDWTEVDKKSAQLNYFEPTDWATSNSGIYSIKSMFPGYYATDKPYVVTKGSKEEAFNNSGMCAKLQTVMTNEQGTGPLIPKVTAGSLFLGTFETNMKDVLASTQFGMIYKNPKSVSTVTGKYKYKAGDKFWNNMVADNTGRQDRGSAVAVLYEVDKYTETLTGHDISNSPRIIGSATFICEPTEEYNDFTLTLDYKGKTYDPSKKYKLAIVFSSSAEGDKYYGAAGSTLWIDNVTINVEK